MRNFIIIPLLFCTQLFAQQAPATASASAAAAADPFSATYVFKLIAVMAFILLLIFALAWMMKKMQLNQHSHAGLIKIVSAIAVGQRDRIALIEVGDEQILVALTPGRIAKLHELKKPLELPPQSASTQSFGDKFQQLMKRDSGHADG